LQDEGSGGQFADLSPLRVNRLQLDRHPRPMKFGNGLRNRRKDLSRFRRKLRRDIFLMTRRLTPSKPYLEIFKFFLQFSLTLSASTSQPGRAGFPLPLLCKCRFHGKAMQLGPPSWLYWPTRGHKMNKLYRK
jgi:hypothetical protein